MSNSNLISYTQLSPYHSGVRKKPIKRFTPHCYVGQVTVERGGSGFASRPKGKEASCNYLIGCDGRIALIVPEGYRSWCSSSNDNDQQAVTVEVASDSYKPFAFNQAAYNSLVDLCADVMKRNGKTVLVYIPDKNTALKYNPKDNELLITFHKWFKSSKTCPGEWFINKCPQFVDDVMEKLHGYAEVKLVHKVKKGDTLSKIAREYNTTVANIMGLNSFITDPNKIKVGWEVRVR